MAKNVQDYIAELREYQARSTNYIPTVAAVTNGNNNNSPYRGRLIFNITHSRGAFPVANALITIYDDDTIINAVTTDDSGKSPTVTLEAFDKRFSESPGSDIGNITKYYNAKIDADGFVSVMIKNIPIYENVTTLQSYDMLYKSAVTNDEIITVTQPDNATV